MRHVASISGAFHGVITTATPGGVPAHVVRVTRRSLEVVDRELSAARRRRSGSCTRPAGMTEFSSSGGGSRCRGSRPRRVGSPCLDSLRDAVEDLGALLGRHRAPGLETLLGGVHRACGFVLAASSDLGDRRLVDRRDVGEGRAGRDALAADPMVGRDLDAFDLDAPAQCRPPSDSFVSERYGGR